MADYLASKPEIGERDSRVTVISGSDSIEFLNRSLSTNISDIAHLERIESVFCDQNGRIIDIATLCRLEDKILMLSQSRNDIRQRIISGVSWSEDVSIVDADNAISHFTMIGVHWRRALLGLGLDIDELESGKWVEFGNMLVSYSIIMGGDSELLDFAIPKGEVGPVLGSLIDNGCAVIENDRWNFTRTNLGLVCLTDAQGRIPFDVNLGKLIDLNKGCYPGQEIHARMESRGGISKQIVRLISENPIDVGRHRVEDIGRIEVVSSANSGQYYASFAIVDNAEISNFEVEIAGIGARIEQITVP